MQLKVNNCGECPFKDYDREYNDYDCRFKRDPYKQIMSLDLSKIREDCKVNNGKPFKIKTSPITIKLNEDESK